RRTAIQRVMSVPSSNVHTFARRRGAKQSGRSAISASIVSVTASHRIGTSPISAFWTMQRSAFRTRLKSARFRSQSLDNQERRAGSLEEDVGAAAEQDAPIVERNDALC